MSHSPTESRQATRAALRLVDVSVDVASIFFAPLGFTRSAKLTTGTNMITGEALSTFDKSFAVIKLISLEMRTFTESAKRLTTLAVQEGESAELARDFLHIFADAH